LKRGALSDNNFDVKLARLFLDIEIRKVLLRRISSTNIGRFPKVLFLKTSTNETNSHQDHHLLVPLASEKEIACVVVAAMLAG
jgi:hypothetical protein